MSVRQQIRDAAIAALNVAPPAGVPTATKRRYIPGQKLSEPRLACFFAEEEASRIGGPASALTRRRMTLLVQAAIVVEDPADADDTIEALLAHVVTVLGDTNLGGLATVIEEGGTRWVGGPDDAGLFILSAATSWSIQYQTKRADLTARS